MSKKEDTETLSEKRRKAALSRWGVDERSETVSIRCDADAAKLVKAEAAKRNIRASAIVAEAIRAYFRAES